MMFDFQDKVVLVTGSARGIGRAIAEKFVELGAKVVISDLNQEAVEIVAAEIGDSSIGVAANVVKPDDIENLLAKTVEKFGRIDVLVNNAGITRDTLMMRMSEDDWDRVLDTNLKGAFLVTKAAARLMMKQRSGRIVNISSVVGLIGNAGQVNYSSSKAGLIGLTKSAAKELASRGVTVNAVAPGFIETDMTKALSDTARENLLSVVPAKRTGQPDDVATAVVFLASDEAAYITGEVIRVDGGMAM
ncbi:MAG: 3-oxoacyl-[acyl-carrier-protein] reductase [candidate division Zixibacteria bacterium]|nr:3-oxoacyl-[acyl-carrier-protein] reductase [candidate division Zixibacteria bacterium]